jgi:hypothetical protein
MREITIPQKGNFSLVCVTFWDFLHQWDEEKEIMCGVYAFDVVM